PHARALSQSVALIAGIDNDIFSFHREEAVGQKNIVHILMRDHECSAPQATAAAVDMRNRVTCLYARLRHKITAGGDLLLGRYAQDLGHVVSGHLQWTQSTDRYHIGPPVPVVFTDDTTGIDPAPIPLSATAWWWDLL